MSTTPSSSPVAVDTSRLEDPFADGVSTEATSAPNAAAPESTGQKHMMLLLVDSHARITVPGVPHGIGQTCSVLEYCQNISDTAGKLEIPAGSILNFHSITPASFGMAVATPTAPSAFGFTQSGMADPVQIAAAQAINAGIEVKTSYYEDFVALNNHFFNGVNLPNDKVVDTDHVSAIVIRGTPVVFHYIVIFTYFPSLLCADFVRTLRDEFDALTVAVLILSFYHDDNQRLNFASGVDQQQLRALYALWLATTPKIDDVLVDAAWDALDELVFNPSSN